MLRNCNQYLQNTAVYSSPCIFGLTYLVTSKWCAQGLMFTLAILCLLYVFIIVILSCKFMATCQPWMLYSSVSLNLFPLHKSHWIYSLYVSLTEFIPFIPLVLDSWKSSTVLLFTSPSHTVWDFHFPWTVPLPAASPFATGVHNLFPFSFTTSSSSPTTEHNSLLLPFTLHFPCASSSPCTAY